MAEEPIPAAGSPLKRSLWKHYVRQYHEASCSVASVATVVNALGEGIGQAGEIIQMDLIDKVKTGNWKKRVNPEGDNGKRGLPLALLGEVVRGSLEAFLDVNRYQSAHYSIPFERFYWGISKKYHQPFGFFGLPNGGYVYIRL